MSVITIQPDATVGIDAFANEASPNTNYGSDTSLEIGFRPANAKKYRGYILFDVSGLAGKSIDSATLTVYMWNTDESVTSNTTWSINKVTSSWVESTLTWNLQPTFDSSPAATLTFTGNTIGNRVFDITALVQAWCNGGVTNNGIVIKQNDESSAVLAGEVYTSDYTTDTSKRPKLDITYHTDNSKTLIETVTITEAVVKTISKIFVEYKSITEVFIRLITKGFTELFTITDFMTKVRTVYKTPTESVYISEIIKRYTTKNLIDSIPIIESVAVVTQYFRTFIEIITPTDLIIKILDKFGSTFNWIIGLFGDHKPLMSSSNEKPDGFIVEQDRPSL